RIDACVGRRPLQHVIDGALGQMAAAGRGKYRIIDAGVASQGQQRASYNLGQQHLAALVTLPEHAELHLAAIALDHIRPGQGDELGDAKASSIANLDEDAIAPRWSSAHQQANLDLADYALRDAASLGMCLDDGAGVELQISDPMAVREQRFHAQEDLALAR